MVVVVVVGRRGIKVGRQAHVNGNAEDEANEGEVEGLKVWLHQGNVQN